MDDDGAYTRLVAENAAEHGYRAVVVAEPEDALARLRARRFELAVIDMEVCRGSPLPFMARVKAEQPEVMIIAVTALRCADTFMSALSAGASECQSKPSEPAKLAARIRDVLDRRAGPLETKRLRLHELGELRSPT